MNISEPFASSLRPPQPAWCSPFSPFSSARGLGLVFGLNEDATKSRLKASAAEVRDTVYKGIRAGSPLFPQAGRKGAGPKAWLHFTTESIETSDRHRIAFYKTTPSWHDLFGAGASAAPVRRAAAQVIKAPDKAPRRRETD